jgi:hypothetical protein
VSKRKELEAALAKAEAFVTEIEEKQSKAIDSLEKARAHCHKAYVALIKHKRSEPTT